MGEVIDKFIMSRTGECTTMKMIHDYMKASPGELIPETINYYNIQRILKGYLQYSWIQSEHRDPKSLDPRNTVRRELFVQLRDMLLGLGYVLVYIDEASFNPQGISTYTWQKKTVKNRLIRGSETAINAIAAWISKTKFTFMLKKGTTEENHIIRFFELLDGKLSDWFGEQYKKSIVFVLDNACVHTSAKVTEYIKWKKLMVLTLPPYSPEFNPIERVFHRVKKRLKHLSLYKRRLEYVLAEVVQSL
jgi:hypothetical protein